MQLIVDMIILKYVYVWLSLCLHCSKAIVNVALEPNIYTIDNCWALEQQCCLLWRSFYSFSMKMTNNIQPALRPHTLDINNNFLLTSKSHDLNMHLSWDSTHFAGVANLMLTIMLTIMVTQTNHGIIHKRYDIYTYACLFNNIFLMALGNKKMQDSIIFNPGLLCLSIYLLIIYICTI